MNNLNSFFKWYPLIKDIVPTPKTIMIPREKEFIDIDIALSPAYGGEVKEPEMIRLVAEADKAAKVLGGYPVFLRSDETSYKHEWVDSCFIPNKASLGKGMANIYEFTLMNDFSGLEFNGIVIREFLDLPHEFHAFKGMPVSQEFRFFIKNGYVQCRHPYWFPGAMRRVDVDDWLPKLRKLQELPEATKQLLDNYARAVSKAVEPLGAPDNYWSVDFCYANGKGWVVTDMAVGEDSYHYGTCPFAPKEMLTNYGNPETIPEDATLTAIHDRGEKLKLLLDELASNANHCSSETTKK